MHTYTIIQVKVNSERLQDIFHFWLRTMKAPENIEEIEIKSERSLFQQKGDLYSNSKSIRPPLLLHENASGN